MFHANTWSINFSAPITGASLVLPGPKLDGASIYELLDRYKVSASAGVPTVWLMLLQHLAATGNNLPHLKRIVIGGSACPRAMAKTFQDAYGVEVIHAWGMTEMVRSARVAPWSRNMPGSGARRGSTSNRRRGTHRSWWR